MTAVAWADGLDVADAFVDGMPAEQYHAHPSLSSSGVRALLRSPARFRWERDHPRSPTREMELGTCVHTEVLDSGQLYTVTDSEEWRTKAAKDQVAEIQARGRIPLRPSEYTLVEGMFYAVRRHALAGPLLQADRGTPERALFWRDEQTGVDCRALVDFSPHNRRSLVDLKTTADASPAGAAKSMARYGYAIQAAFYLRGARALGLADERTEFVWVFVERDPPHLVAVYRLAPVDLAWADERCTAALERYRDCAAVDVWPGYSDELQTITLPPWSRRDYEPEEYA